MEPTESHETARHARVFFTDAEEEAVLRTKAIEIQKKLVADTWDIHKEILIQSWGEKAHGLRYMHNKASSNWNSRNNRMAYTIVSLTVAAGICNLLGVNTIPVTLNDAPSIVVIYVASVVQILMGLVNGLQKFWRAEQKATEHRLTEHQLESFYRQISEELGMKREEREEARQFLGRMRREYDRIQMESPRLSEQHINEFRQNFPNVRNAPDIAAEEFTIVIHSVEETERLAASQGRVELPIE